MLPKTGCWSRPRLITVCSPAAWVWTQSVSLRYTQSDWVWWGASVWMWGENKRISSVPGVWGKWTQCINLPGCSSPPNEVCEKSLLIKYRGCGRCLSFFIRKKRISSISQLLMREVVLVVDVSLASRSNLFDRAAGWGWKLLFLIRGNVRQWSTSLTGGYLS